MASFKKMKWLWNCSGACFGHRTGNNLWTYKGDHIGRFIGDEVYDKDGRYMGEIVEEIHLAYNPAKSKHRRGGFEPFKSGIYYPRAGTEMSPHDCAPLEDFPDADSFA